MKINRNNYEQWFIDYLDGMLDPHSVKELEAFLKMHPKLAEELDSIGNVRLEPEHVSFSRKASLLKESAENVCPERADYLLIKQMEEGLNQEEENELEKWMASDANFLKRRDSYQLTRLKAPALSFDGKEKLLRKRVAPRFSGKFYRWASVAAAALVVLYFGLNRIDVASDHVDLFSPSRLDPRGFSGFEAPEVPVVLAEVGSGPFQTENPANSLPQNHNSLTDKGEKKSFEPATENASKISMSEIIPQKRRPIAANLLHVEPPDAYEEGLRHMMPLYLELNRHKQKLLAGKKEEGAPVENKSLIVRGMQLMDKLGGEMVHFDKVYDEEGNYVAFNFKTGVFEVEKTVKR
ncbi:MAG: anti-sigma factor family protein [Marinilabiliaceae bacterium]